MADAKEKVRIMVPWWPGPVGDEWDSGAYDDFWHLAEQTVNQRILAARKEGKEIELVAPDDSQGKKGGSDASTG